MPLVRRVPKRGFTNIFRKEYDVVNLERLQGLEGEVTIEAMVAAGFVRKGSLVKILGSGEIKNAINVKAHKFSKSAQAKIEAAGGSCEVVK